MDKLTTAPLAPSAFTSCCRVARSRTLSSSPSHSLCTRLRPPLAVAARAALSRLAAARHSRRRRCSSGATTSGIPPPKPSPGITPWPLAGPPKPAHHHPKPPASCRRDTPWPPSPCSRGTHPSSLPPPRTTPQLAPPCAGEPPRPEPTPNQSSKRRRRSPDHRCPPPLRGATTAGHHLELQDLLEVVLGPLLLFPSGAPTARASPRQEKTRPCSSVLHPTRDPR